MKITVYRPNQIGGCITEIESKSGTRIIIDVGSNLPGNNEGEKVDVRKITEGCEGVFITHYHGDHVGEFESVDDNVTIYMGEVAHEIFLNLCEHLRYVRDIDVDKVKKFNTFQAADRIEVGDIFVTPYRVDHSAFDSYMFMIECDGKRILHTGDFRTHGWTGKGVSALLRKYVRKIDALICEGTMLSRRADKMFTEYDLYLEAKKILNDNKNVFVLCSSTNIDSIASFYKAACDIKKLVVADRYQRLNLDIASASARSPLYKFPYVKIYWDGRQDCIDEMRRRDGFCMFVRPGGDKFKKIMAEFPDSLLVYSMWEGYLKDNTRNNEIYDFIPKDSKGIPAYKYLHTSGHAYEESIISLCMITKPDIIFPIHSEAPGRFEELEREGKISGEVKRLESGISKEL
ncbi:MAG: MBL fold metallo-hydrolase [Oscillospiraceae bacterium]|nr:MBL fold metallo-hydrolase [Oscillospiraceae bacterium]